MIRKSTGVLSNDRFPIVVCALMIALALGSCSPKEVDPMLLGQTARDKQEAPFPPTEQELSVSPHLMLTLVTYKDPTVTESRLSETLAFIHHTFERNANFSAIPKKKVDELLSTEENRRFQADNVADAIQMGKMLNASFVAQAQVMITESEVVDSIDHYVAKTNLTIFTTDSGQVVFKKDVFYDSQDPEGSKGDLKRLVQQYFPLRAYILETRGDRQYGKISIGRSLGVKIGREFQVRNRQVKNEIVAGKTRRKVSFGALAIATVEVVKVMEDEAWVFIAEEDRNKVMKGQVVFSLPEKRFGVF